MIGQLVFVISGSELYSWVDASHCEKRGSRFLAFGCHCWKTFARYFLLLVLCIQEKIFLNVVLQDSAKTVVTCNNTPGSLLLTMVLDKLKE